MRSGSISPWFSRILRVGMRMRWWIFAPDVLPLHPSYGSHSADREIIVRRDHRVWWANCLVRSCVVRGLVELCCWWLLVNYHGFLVGLAQSCNPWSDGPCRSQNSHQQLEESLRNEKPDWSF